MKHKTANANLKVHWTVQDIDQLYYSTEYSQYTDDFVPNLTVYLKYVKKV